MIGFIIPIKPKKFSKNWEYDNQLLERTIKSIAQQTDDQFIIFIVYNDKPDINFKHPSIIWIEFNFSFVRVEDISDYKYVSKWYKPDYAEKMFDKGRKISYGTIYAKKYNCHYIMAIDSDDLISNKISWFVNTNNRNEPGWVITKGYMYVESSSFLTRNHQIQNINGSTHIIRKDLVPETNMNSLNFKDFDFFESHGYLFQRIKDLYNLSLLKFPFYGVIYTVHKNNTSVILEILNSAKIKKLVKLILYGKFITKKLRKEFYLYKL